MRSLSSRERRLMMFLLAAGFFILNFLGYQALAQRRTAAVAQQRTLRFDIERLRELQGLKPEVDLTSEWLDAHLPAYKDIDQLETHLFNVVTNKAVAAGVELSKKDPRPTQTDALVHRSILEVETTAGMENLVTFLHSLQDREDFRFISFLELTPTKDEERVRCQARLEQWWRPDSDQLAGLSVVGVPMLPEVAPAPVLIPPAGAGEGDASDGGEALPEAGDESSVERPAPEAVQPVSEGAASPPSPQ